MHTEEAVRGIILKSSPAGEYDKRVSILTLEIGKISCFCRGVRRQGSPLLAASLPLCYGTFRVYEGRGYYRLSGADIENYFTGLREDLAASMYASYLLELSDYYAAEGNPEPELLKLLYVSLRALEKESLNKQLVRFVFELRALSISGEYPGLPKGAFLEDTRYTVDFVLKTPLQKLYTFSVSEGVLQELDRLCEYFRRLFVERELKSLEYLSLSQD